jgi:hypothetical protein
MTGSPEARCWKLKKLLEIFEKNYFLMNETMKVSSNSFLKGLVVD